MNKYEAIEKMNWLGTKAKPFVFIVDFMMQKPLIFELDKCNNKNLLFQFPNASNFPQIEMNKKILFNTKYLDFEHYKKCFDIVMKNILLGNSYLVNLTAAIELETNLSLFEIFNLSNAKYKLWYADVFTFFSPETFVKIQGNKIYSYPMKGTIDASIINAEKMILEDKKEIAEHYTIVDLIRNDLNIIAKNVKVDKFRYIDSLQTTNKELLQVSSVVSGELPENFAENLGNILFSLLPAGSISGAPKKKTVEIIVEAENYQRGYYTGIAGFFDGKNLDSCVMIRFVEKSAHKMFYKTGGGITAMSNCESEYNELLSKIYIPLS